MKPIAMDNRPSPRRCLRRFGGSISMSIVATALMAGCGAEEGSSVRADSADSSAETVDNVAASSSLEPSVVVHPDPEVVVAPIGTFSCTEAESAALEQQQRESAKTEVLPPKEVRDAQMARMIEEQIAGTFFCDGTYAFVDTTPAADGRYAVWSTIDRERRLGYWPAPAPPGQTLQQ